MKEAAALTSPILADTLMSEEIALEQDAIAEGARRYMEAKAQAEARGDGAMLKPAERLLAHWHRVVADLIALDLLKWAGWMPIHRPRHYEMTSKISPDVLAVCAMHEMVGQCLTHHNGAFTVSVACAVGRSVAAEYHAALIREDKEAAEQARWNKRLRSPREWNDFASKVLDENSKFGISARIAAGGWLMSFVMKWATMAPWDDAKIPAFEEKKLKRGVHVRRVLFLTKEAKDTIDQGHELRKYTRPRYLPMLVPPYSWTQDAEGGYIQIRTPLVAKITRAQRVAVKAAMAAGTLKEFHDGLTAISAQPWRINRDVYRVQREMWERGGNMLGVPRAEELPIPPRPADFDNLSDSAKRTWKKQASEVYGLNERVKGARRQFLERMSVAERFLNREEFYYPHMGDFRGRVYPIPATMNHHGDDVCRGMLEFADAAKPGVAGLKMLKIHAANSYGVDKLPFSGRVAWADEHITPALLEAIKADPLSVEWWQKAENPWQFLAACYALADPNGAGARLPVGMDGTCNGLQHFAALSRDATAAAAVNLVPGDRPGDVYAQVAASLLERVERDIADGVEIAIAVRPFVNRKMVKQPTMTTAYRVTDSGVRGQISGTLEEAGMDRALRKQAVAYLLPRMKAAIAAVCCGAVATMEWLEACARRLLEAKPKDPITWTTPDGFPVVQDYRRWESTMVETAIGRIYAMNPEAESPISVRQQISGIAPNYIHSLDATHIRRTAVVCRNSGIAFAGVHDSYLTHARDVTFMGRILREEFHRIHQADQLSRLREEWSGIASDLPEPPASGELDLNGVLESPYFFS